MNPTKKLWLFFTLLSVTFGYFYHGGGFNQNSIIGEIREAVENHRVHINNWEPVTGDVSYYKNRVFSNKSPNLLFFVAPIYAVIHPLAKGLSAVFDFDLNGVFYQMFISHLLTFLCSGLWAALIGVLYVKILPQLYPSLGENDTYLLSYLLTMGSFNFPYSGSAMIVNFESFWALMVLYQLVRVRDIPSRARVIILALSCGCLMLANPFCFLIMPIVYGFVWFNVGPRKIMPLVTLSFGALVPLIPLFIYNHINFDFFLSSNRNHLAPVWTDPNLFLGVFGKPEFWRVFEIFGPGSRSILTTVPFIFFALPSLSKRFRGDAQFPRWLLPYVGGMFTIFFLLLLSFNGWHGGTCFGPRYFLLVLPLLALLTVPIFLRWRSLYLLVISWSLVIMGVAAANGIWLDASDAHPVRTLLKHLSPGPAFMWPAFPGPNHSFNIYDLGDLLGIPGHWSLAPLIVLHALVVPKLLVTSFQISEPVRQTLSTSSLAYRVCYFLVITLILSRLGSPFLSPFINDEPLIQLRINSFLDGGPLPLVGLHGSQPIPYGPIPTWFYALVRVINDQFSTFMPAHTLTHVFALFLLWHLLIKNFSRWVALLAVALTASSPFLFNYSRLSWDNTFLFPLSMGIVFSAFKVITLQQAGSYPRTWWLILGALSGLALGTHLMVLPLLAGTYLFTTFYDLKQPVSRSLVTRLKMASLSLIPMLLVLSPYLTKVTPLLKSVGSEKHWGGATNIHVILSKIVGFTSLHGFSDYFFQGDIDEFSKTLHPITLVLQHFDAGWFVKGPILILLFWPLFLLFRGKIKILKDLPPMLLYASITTYLSLIFYIYTGHFSHPHYYNYLWWITPTCCAYILSSHWKKGATMFLFAVMIVAASNLNFIYAAKKYITANEGIRGFGWGATVKNQKRLIKNICADAKIAGIGQVDVGLSGVWILPASLMFLAREEPACTGVEFSFKDHGTYQVIYAASRLDQPGPRSRLEFEKKM